MPSQKDLIQQGVASNTAAAMTGYSQTGITALAGGANSASTPVLAFGPNMVSTVAAGSDSVKLPPGARSGDWLTLRSTVATNAVAVFPPTGGTINGGSANAAFSMTAQKGALFQCLSDDGLTWLALLSA